jgi:hypothetical protein
VRRRIAGGDGKVLLAGGVYEKLGAKFGMRRIHTNIIDTNADANTGCETVGEKNV